ncbi:MAG: hypothetical protein JSS12_06085 [Verrucomicrobia bacterium]|nr:hypothetical protein [Verrucomicrobiota bacterium]
MSLLQAAAEWVKTGGKVHLLSTNQISRLLTLFKDAGANVKDIHASRIASGDLIRPSKMAEKVFQGRVNNQVINQDTVTEERLKQGEIHAKEHESTTGLQSKSARAEKKEEFIQNAGNKIEGTKRYKESQKPILDAVNKQWEEEYASSKEKSPERVRFNEDVEVRHYGVFEEGTRETHKTKLKADGINTEYRPGCLEVNIAGVAKLENPGFLRLEAAFIKLVEPDASKRAEKTFIAAQGARQLFTECLHDVTQQVKNKEISAEEAPARLRELLLKKMVKDVELTAEQINGISSRGELPHYNIPPKDVLAAKKGEPLSRTHFEEYGYFNAGQHRMEVNYYLFGNNPERFEQDKGKTPNKQDYSDFLQGLKNHFEYHQKMA